MILVLLAQLQGSDSGTRGHGKEEGGSLQIIAAVQVKATHGNKKKIPAQTKKENAFRAAGKLRQKCHCPNP